MPTARANTRTEGSTRNRHRGGETHPIVFGFSVGVMREIARQLVARHPASAEVRRENEIVTGAPTVPAGWRG